MEAGIKNWHKGTILYWCFFAIFLIEVILNSLEILKVFKCYKNSISELDYYSVICFALIMKINKDILSLMLSSPFTPRVQE